MHSTARALGDARLSMARGKAHIGTPRAPYGSQGLRGLDSYGLGGHFIPMRRIQLAALLSVSVLWVGTATAQGFARNPMTVGEKFSFFEEPVFGPRAATLASVTSALRLAIPPDRYPHEWRDGVGAYGRNVGDHYARHAAQSTASFAASALLHEDPRWPVSLPARCCTRIRAMFRQPARRFWRARCMPLVTRWPIA